MPSFFSIILHIVGLKNKAREGGDAQPAVQPPSSRRTPCFTRQQILKRIDYGTVYASEDDTEIVSFSFSELQNINYFLVFLSRYVRSETMPMVVGEGESND